ncbi:MAG: rRNA pseudouridine synthase [Oscillospiraceae bacterium]|nr:rRNA pseudouridine synthase [Oscillospiraceae bacterium]
MIMRLQKLIAASGFCSRRAAEELIRSGRVAVNGETASLGDSADSERDQITIDNKPLRQAAERTYIMLNKPRGYVTTMSDERGRKTVADLISGLDVRVFPVGRLDMDSEGMLLMTNDGELANALAHPSGEIEKTYKVRVRGSVSEASLNTLRQPLVIDGKPIKPAKVQLLGETTDSALISVTISEGRNRQVRKMCDLAGLEVLRLKRVAEGGLSLGDLPSGKWRFLNAKEIASLHMHTNT